MWQESTPTQLTRFPGLGAVHENIPLIGDFPIGLNLPLPAPKSKSVVGRVCVRTYEDEFQSLWDDYVSHHPFGSIFHSTAWKRVVERAFEFEPRYLFLEEQGKIRGVLPLFLVHNLVLGSSLISTPLAVYGGPCADNEQLSAQLRRAARE